MSTVGKAQQEAIVFLQFLKDLSDPRQPGKVIYALPDVPLLCLTAVPAAAANIVEIARWGQGRVNFRRRFLAFKMEPVARSARHHLRHA